MNKFFAHDVVFCFIHPFLHILFVNTFALSIKGTVNYTQQNDTQKTMANYIRMNIYIYIFYGEFV